MPEKHLPWITNDAVVLGMLFTILSVIFFTTGSAKPFWKKLYTFVPGVLLCFFIPALLNTFNVISGEKSQLYHIASRYFLPPALILLTMGVDIASLKKLGSKSLIMFFSASVGVMFGGPLILWLVGSMLPDVLMSGNEETWRGFATIAGSWIGGSANQAAMLEVFGASKSMFGQMLAVDVLVSYTWMGILLYSSRHVEKINKWLKADSRSIAVLQKRMEQTELNIQRKRTGTREWIMLLGVAFGFAGLAHFSAANIAPFFANNFPASARYSLTNPFFWTLSFSAFIGVALSFTKARKLEAYGAADMGTLFLYFLVAAIGTHMNLKALLDNPTFLLVAVLWLMVHIVVLFIVAKIIKAPFFFVAIASQSNIGGTASAPIVAAAFNKYLAPVGVLLAVLAYAVGTYAAYLCGLGMQYVTGLLK